MTWSRPSMDSLEVRGHTAHPSTAVSASVPGTSLPWLSWVGSPDRKIVTFSPNG